MGEFPRKSDGRRVFTVEFKRGVVQQLKGKKTLAAVSRELDIRRAWCGSGSGASKVSALREAHQRIRELERLLGKK